MRTSNLVPVKKQGILVGEGMLNTGRPGSFTPGLATLGEEGELNSDEDEEDVIGLLNRRSWLMLKDPMDTLHRRFQPQIFHDIHYDDYPQAFSHWFDFASESFVT